MKIKIGCDPELFVKDAKTGEIISAHDLLPGTKVDPYKVAAGAVQVDGAAAEFNIDPSNSPAEFVRNIKTVMDQLKVMLKDNQFHIEPFVTFPKDYFTKLPESVRELGCNPDWNAWTGQVNPAPEGDSTTLRTASGHLHIGWCEGMEPHSTFHFEDCCSVVKQLDYYLGMTSLIWDKDPTRRQLYGKAGAFRPKPYGVEYRVLSNVWLKSQRLQEWIWHVTQKAINDLSSGNNMWVKYGDYARQIIDSNDIDWVNKKEALKVWQSLDIPSPPTLIEETEVKKPVRKRKVAHHTYDEEAA